MDDETRVGFGVGCGIVLLVVLFIAIWMAVGPVYRVWSREQAGRAELAQAQWNRQIAVQEAEAKKTAATLLASAEVERAKGVAEANRIIGESLKGNDAYLRYLWIDKLEQGEGRETIYVATEAGLPILEATRRMKPTPAAR